MALGDPSCTILSLSNMVPPKYINVLTIACLARFVSSAPPGFPQSGNGLWYAQPGVVWFTDYLPIGNGYLAGEMISKYSMSIRVIFT